MPGPSKNSVYRLTMEAIAEDQAVVNVTHWYVDTTSTTEGTQAQLLAFVDLMNDRWVNNILPLLSDRLQMRKYSLTEITGIIYNPTVRETYNSLAWRTKEPDDEEGGVDHVQVDAMAIQNCVTVRLLTDYGGRRWRGAIRYGCIPEDVADGTRIVKQKREAFQGATDLLFADAPAAFGDHAGAVWKPVVYSKTDAFEHYNAQPNILLYTRNITSRYTNLFIGTQNSRKISNQGM